MLKYSKSYRLSAKDEIENQLLEEEMEKQDEIDEWEKEVMEYEANLHCSSLDIDREMEEDLKHIEHEGFIDFFSSWDFGSDEENEKFPFTYNDIND